VIEFFFSILLYVSGPQEESPLACKTLLEEEREEAMYNSFFYCERSSFVLYSFKLRIVGCLCIFGVQFVLVSSNL